MNLRFPWYVRLGGIILLLTGPIAAAYANPYFIWGGKEAEAARRFKNYRNVHFKSKDQVVVRTPEGDSVFARFEEGDLPEPTFAIIATDAEVQENGLYVIGAKMIKRKPEGSD